MSWMDRLPWIRRRAEREEALHHSQAAIAASEKRLQAAERLHDRAKAAKEGIDRTLEENRLRLKMERAFGVDR